MKTVVKVNVCNIQNSSVLSRLQEIMSSWIKMERMMALMITIKGVWLNVIGNVSFFNSRMVPVTQMI